MTEKARHLLREVNTRKLLRHLISKYPKQALSRVDGLVELTWLGNKAKCDGLNRLFDTNLRSIDDIARKVGDARLKILIAHDTGFVNFYRAYRNTANIWAAKHKASLESIVRRTLLIKENEHILPIAKSIEGLPGIPKANYPRIRMACDSYVTPLLACIDPIGMFPVVNRAVWVIALHRFLGISNASFSEKVHVLLEAMTKQKVASSLHLDVYGVEAVKGLKRNFAAELRKVSKELVPRDDGDITYFMQEKRKHVVRTHRKMENALREYCLLRNKIVKEGTLSSSKYDARILNYRKGRDLLLELKGSISSAEIRLAFGQVFDYAYDLDESRTDKAILLPSKPNKRYINIGKNLGVHMIWFVGKKVDGTLRLE